MTIAAAASANAGGYTVIVSNAYGSVSSAAAVLSWPPPGQLFNLVTFDDLPETTTGLAVSNSYANLGWENFDELDGKNYPGPSGYNAAVISPGNVVYNDSGNAAGITNAEPFDLVSAYLTSVWRDGLEVEVTGYAGNVALYDNTYALSATEPTLIQFNYAAVNTVVFASSGGTVHPGYSGTNAEFAMDNVAFLLTVSPPQIISQPPNQVAASGSTASFSVTVSGGQPLSYQWQKNGQPLNDAGTVSGSATATLSLAGVSVADEGVYTVAVTLIQQAKPSVQGLRLPFILSSAERPVWCGMADSKPATSPGGPLRQHQRRLCQHQPCLRPFGKVRRLTRSRQPAGRFSFAELAHPARKLLSALFLAGQPRRIHAKRVPGVLERQRPL